MADPTHVNITINPCQAGKTAEQDIARTVRETLQRQASPFNSLFGKYATGGVVTSNIDPEAVRSAFGMPHPCEFMVPTRIYRTFGMKMTPTIASTFVEPERPAEPQPEPDSPAVAMLRPLVIDRKNVAQSYEYQITATEEEIENLEKELIETKARLEHERNCKAKAEAELKDAEEAIVKLGGTV